MIALYIILIFALFFICRWVIAIIYKHSIFVYTKDKDTRFSNFQIGFGIATSRMKRLPKNEYNESWHFYLGNKTLTVSILPEGKKIGNNYELIDENDKEEKKNA